MSNFSLKLGVALVCLFACLDAEAQRSELSDNLSPRQNYVLELAFSPEMVNQALAAMFESDDATLPPLRGRLTDVEVRLDVSEYVGSRARIFMSIPRNIAGDSSGTTLDTDFRGRGDFESGSIRPGQEALIYDGVIDGGVISGAFDFVISITNTGSDDTLDFELAYEIEILD